MISECLPQYGIWTISKKSREPFLCIAEVTVWGDEEDSYHQCQAVPGHGPDGLFCEVHARKIEEKQSCTK